MRKTIEQNRPRYLERNEAVVHGLGDYFHRRLERVWGRLSEIRAVQEKKQAIRNRLPTNPIGRWMATLPYGDWLNDYETGQIELMVRAQVKLTEIMTEVVGSGRVDRAEAELRETIRNCFSYLQSWLRANDHIGRAIGVQTMAMAGEAIEALAIISPDDAAEFQKRLEVIKESEAFWRHSIME